MIALISPNFAIGGSGSDSNTNSEEVQSTESRRWRPTWDQRRVLEHEWSVKGIRNPSREEMDKIAAKLNIEARNVYYWFQNQKARRKKRLALDTEAQGGQTTIVLPVTPPASQNQSITLDEIHAATIVLPATPPPPPPGSQNQSITLDEIHAAALMDKNQSITAEEAHAAKRHAEEAHATKRHAALMESITSVDDEDATPTRIPRLLPLFPTKPGT
ncbi:hypothetical protein SUGI_1036700 [Cryptomeria japonica]|nr:hypothetical protein SUGI_1036700 [Cryptomeria japonica]